MPQFDLVLYFPIFILFSFIFFIFYLFLNLFILPYFWNILYIRYAKKQYNLFFKLLNEIQLIHLLNLNLSVVNYLNKILKISVVNRPYMYEILNIISLSIFKFGKKND